MVEVSEIYKDNLLRVQEDGTTTQLLKNGLYGFDADNGEIRVFKGEALVQDGDQNIKVKGGRELEVNNTTGKLKTTSSASRLTRRPTCIVSAICDHSILPKPMATQLRRYIGGGPGWYGAGWYWDPFFTAYTWIPGDGMFYSPFGWGFYSPWFVSYSPFYYGRYYGYGYAGHARPYYGGHAGAYVARPGNSAPRMENGFHGTPSMGASHFGVTGGGFHGAAASADTKCTVGSWPRPSG